MRVSVNIWLFVSLALLSVFGTVLHRYLSAVVGNPHPVSHVCHLSLLLHLFSCLFSWQGVEETVSEDTVEDYIDKYITLLQNEAAQN